MPFSSKLFLGGGGGGGHQNNNVGTPGSNGGGIIIIKTTTLTSNNFSISSNGDNVTIDSGIDGAGGGGGGGSIILDVVNFVSNLSINANGGNGGNTNNGFTGGGTGAQCVGPGGGGGLIALTTPSFPINVLPSISGGNPGLTVNVQSACLGTSYGAASGQNGLTQTSIVLNESNLVPIGSVIASNDTAVCNGTCAQLNATGATSYIWSPSIGLSDSTIANPLACPTLTTTYIVTGTDTNNCTSTDTVVITVNPSFQATQNISICQGDSVFLGGSFQNTTGQYTDSLSTSLGCDSLIITNLIVNPTFNDSIVIAICQGDSIFLSGNFQHNSGIFIDNLQSVFGCDSVVTVNLNVNPIPIVVASENVIIEACSSTSLSASGASNYLWSPINGLSCFACPNPIASPINTTTYIVTGNTNGCFSSDTLTVFVEEGDPLIIPNVFTPNFDGMNDGFNVVGGCITSINKKIYNRWGQLLFESNQIVEEWDGRTRAGEEVPEGSYFYIFTINLKENGNETTKIFKGAVTLLR